MFNHENSRGTLEQKKKEKKTQSTKIDAKTINDYSHQIQQQKLG